MNFKDEKAEVLAREERIADLKAQAQALAKDSFSSVENEGVPPEVQEAYWRRLVAFEEAGTTTLAKVLTDHGFELTPPDQLNDMQLSRKLWALIRRMADFRCFLSQTNHLSDRELYTHLLEETLPEEMNATVAKPDPDSAWHIDLLGGGSDEDIQTMLRFYADEEERKEWKQDFPDLEIPEISIPPYDRDDRLPKCNDQLAG